MTRNAWLLLLLLALIPGCSGKAEKNTWGGRETSALVNLDYYQYYWQAAGYLPSATRPNAEWQSAFLFVVPHEELQDREVRENIYRLPFKNYKFTPELFSIENKVCDLTEIVSQKVLFYTDDQGNVRQLIVSHDRFDFFNKHSDGNAPHAEVVAFWNELQTHHSESTVFWKNPHTEYKRTFLPSKDGKAISNKAFESASCTSRDSCSPRITALDSEKIFFN